jgi:curved DNA-binding protein CbpA
MTTQPLDLYAILGIPPHATQAEIGHAYRSLLRQHHPDTRGSTTHSQSAMADAALQQLLDAYTILRDPTRRAEYDRDRTRHQGSEIPPATRRDPYRRPPIVAGPVRWHRT